MASSQNRESLKHTLKNNEKFNKDVLYIIQDSCALIVNLSSPIIQEIFGTKSGPSTSVFGTNSTMGSYLNRLESFRNESYPWKLDFLTPRQMANAGFYYFGKQDRVGCIYCFREFDHWCRDDDPLDVHKRESPQCPFFAENQGKFNKTSIWYAFLFRILLTFAALFIYEQ